jgi:type I restriction enzyme S subunit
MSSDWETSSLLDHYDVRSGLSKPAKDFGSGFPFLTFKDVFYNYFAPAQLCDLVQSTEKDRVACSVLRGDVFLTRTSETMHELGMSCVALRDYPDATFNGFCKRLRPKPDCRLVPEYVGYYLRSPPFRQAMLAMSTMSTRASLNNEMIGRLEISFPSKALQSRIAAILKSLDDRIALLRETNATLEAIAQAMFKSWFVNFDPVHAKQQGRAPEGMSEATAALFPDSFEESGLGLVPRGWKVAPIGDVVESVGGGTPDTKELSYWEDGVHCWTTPKDLSGIQAPVLLTTERKLTDKGLAKVSSGLLPAGTLLLSSRAPIGYLAIAQAPMAINQGYIAILPNSQLQPLFMLFWCRQNMEIIKGRANGSTFMEISKKAFRPIPAVVSPASVIDAFMQVAGAMFERIVSNEQQAQTLATLRDTLLPRLISGQLRLPQAETALEEVAA